MDKTLISSTGPSNRKQTHLFLNKTNPYVQERVLCVWSPRVKPYAFQSILFYKRDRQTFHFTVVKHVNLHLHILNRKTATRTLRVTAPATDPGSAAHLLGLETLSELRESLRDAWRQTLGGSEARRLGSSEAQI